MGKSPTIKNLSKTDQEFTKFMEELGQNVRAAAETYMGEFQASIQKFYADAGASGKYIQFAAKQHEDYQVETEFSLENIAAVIEKVGKEVFEDQPGYDEEKQKAMVALGEYSGMAVKLAVSFLTNALSALSWKESASYTHDIHHVAVGPGLTLHLMLVNREYEGRGPIKSKKVFQNFIIYELNFSATKAAAEADVLFLQARLDTIADNTAACKTLQKLLLDTAMSPELKKEPADGPLHLLMSTYQGLISQLTAAQTEAYNEVQALMQRQEAADKAAANPGMASLFSVEEPAPNAMLLSYLEEAL